MLRSGIHIPMRFREFLQQQTMPNDGMREEKNDILKTLSRIPRSHSSLVRGYRWKFHAGNTLNGDDEHVGYIDDGTKEIAVAGPWHYAREFTVLHEVAHKVWEAFVSREMREEWSGIVRATKNRQDQSDEELFCMAYAATYCKHPPLIHYHKKWVEFVKGLPS